MIAHWTELCAAIGRDPLLTDALDMTNMEWQQVSLTNPDDNGLFYVTLVPAYGTGQVSVRVGPRPPVAVTMHVRPLDDTREPITVSCKCNHWNDVATTVRQTVLALFPSTSS